MPASLSGLSRALSHLADVEEKVEQVHVEQANGDFYQLSETIRDYVALLGAVKVFDSASVMPYYRDSSEISL